MALDTVSFVYLESKFNHIKYHRDGYVFVLKGECSAACHDTLVVVNATYIN